MGYPLFMKPFDGGGWRGVSKIKSEADLWAAYNDSGEMLMHLQKSAEPFDVFARSLSIGPETMVMNFRPDLPMHDRYAVDHDFLSAGVGQEAITISQTVNAFFRWEFNSCEMLVQGDQVLPIDYANACPDVAVTSLHYYFPWAMKSLVKWTAFCAATDRVADMQVDAKPWFAIADDESLDYADKLAGYQQLADRHFDTDRYREFCEAALPDIDDQVLEWVTSESFDSTAAGHRDRDLSRSRAGPVHGSLPRADRLLDRRRGEPARQELRRQSGCPVGPVRLGPIRSDSVQLGSVRCDSVWPGRGSDDAEQVRSRRGGCRTRPW